MASSPIIRSYASKRALRTIVKSSLRGISDESVASQSLKCMQTILTLPEYNAASRISIYLSMPHREIQTQHLLEHAFSVGKKIYVPYIHKNPSNSATHLHPKAPPICPENKIDETPVYTPPNVMDMLHLPTLAEYEALPRDSWGIPTLPESVLGEGRDCLVSPVPGNGSEVGVDMVILPGVAFGVDGRRLGHGKGYYDYWLQRCMERMNPEIAVEGEEAVSKAKMPFLVGTALREQVFEEGEVPVDGKDWLVDVLITGDGRIVRRPVVVE